jgi:glycerophosphoryl diester phosphodiesterase
MSDHRNAPRKRRAEIIAHRGASADAPENTVASMKLGYAQGADGGELDVHLSRDGRVVVIHDYDTKRVAGVSRKVADQTFDELRRLDVGRWGRWAGKGFAEKLPSLDEILPLVPSGKKLFIEIKCREEVLPALGQSLRTSKLNPEQTAIITFHYEVAGAAKRTFPDREVYWLHEYPEEKDRTPGNTPELGGLIEKARRAGLDGLNLDYAFPLDAAAIQRVHDAGMKVYVWTLDDPVKAKLLVAADIDGITTNRPGELRRALAENRS